MRAPPAAPPTLVAPSSNVVGGVSNCGDWPPADRAATSIASAIQICVGVISISHMVTGDVLATTLKKRIRQLT